MRIVAVLWSNYIPFFAAAMKGLGIRCDAFSIKNLNRDPDETGRVVSALDGADLVVLYRTNDPFWDDIDGPVAGLTGVPVIVTGADPSHWVRSSVAPSFAADAYRYFLYNGQDNFENLARYLVHHFRDPGVAYGEPAEHKWQGIHHPGMEGVFDSIDDYLDAYTKHAGGRFASYTGLMYSRSNWISGNVDIEKKLAAALEVEGIGVIPVFYHVLRDGNIGNMSGAEAVQEFFCREGMPLVKSIIRTTSFYLGKGRGVADESDAAAGADLLKGLNIPLFNPIISYRKDAGEYLEDPQGLGSQVAWSVALPEFEGVIEPVIAGAAANIDTPENERYEAMDDRVKKIARRVARWSALSAVPPKDRKVAFILHNNPCGSVEATVGAGAHLDTLESVADILKRMKGEGYSVDPPADGKALIDEIMNRKAISEFRWTTTDEIVAKGGCLARLSAGEYREWFDELPARTRERMTGAWGNPPGEEKDGMPAAMVHDGAILVTGVRYGNAVVCVQPKRGCAGARCDGQVCKILHDPDVPPPHQYVATYRWLSREFGAHAIVHVGTHGNLEFLPGKAVGLSEGCMPDIAIDTVPHLYIYNADNPPEGTIAKRRSYAALVDHMQTVMVRGELYGDLEALERLLDEYSRYAVAEPGRAHTIGHMIENQAKGLNLFDGLEIKHGTIGEHIAELHDRLSVLKNTQIPKGMHYFGRIPEGEKLAGFVYAVVRYDDGPRSLRGAVARLLGCDVRTDERAYERVEEAAREICRAYILDGAPVRDGLGLLAPDASGHDETAARIEREIDSVRDAVLASDEMGALLNGLGGGYIPPGPSGIVTRGRADILPTGRNFYSLDPDRVPSAAAWEIGRTLADKTLEKFLADEGRYPENIAFYWMCNDIMWADGEGLAQMMYLIGARPVRGADGRCRAFEIIPLEELDRPRIDITVRVSGISRDNFPSRIDLLDDAVRAVAALGEPAAVNYVRKHALARLAETGGDPDNGRDMREATFRIFASMPGTYQAGTQLAVYASAWKTGEDLSDVFLYWNGYAYGKGTFGALKHEHLRSNLRTVEATFNKAVTDEYDLSGCCAYFGAHGGMINAARVVSGKDVRNYYGDTREPGRVTVRTLTEEVRRVARAKILNPKWIEGQKEHGYRGAAEISKRIGRIYGWEATTQAVDDTVFDDITRTFVLDDGNREFFEKNNPWALEEIGRRLLEAEKRGLWNADPEVLEGLTRQYLSIEGWIEDTMGDVSGDFQGGAIDIVTKDDIAAWGDKMKGVLDGGRAK